MTESSRTNSTTDIPLTKGSNDPGVTVRVVLVSYNTAKLTLQAIDSVLQTKIPKNKKLTYEIVVIDNASSDRTLASLRRKYAVRLNRTAHRTWQTKVSSPEVFEKLPSVQRDRAVVTEMLTGTIDGVNISVLLSKENLGFGRANNLALAGSDAQFYFLLNTDAQVSSNTLPRLVSHFKKPRKASTSVLGRARHKLDNPGIIAADLRYPDGSTQRQGGDLPNLSNIGNWVLFIDDIPVLQQFLSSYQHHDSEMRSLRRRPLSKVGWVGGTAMMISAACVDEIGGFDEQLFMYGEDVELCLRATKRHWDVALATDTTVIHVGSASAGSKNALHGEIRGLLHIWKKHRSSQELWVLRQILKLGLHMRVFVFGILRRYGQQRIYAEALELV